jgi:hypothetical protein
MPRQQRPVDPSAGPVQRFAFELRKLRDEAGTPTYRELAEQTHFARATLAAATSGHRLPTLDVTLAFVQACAGNTDEWQTRWHDCRRELGLADDDEFEPAQPVAPTVPSFRMRPMWIVSAAVLLAGIALAAVLVSNQSPPASSPASTRFVPHGPLSAQPVIDGADPKRTLCASDPGVRTLDSVEVNTPGEEFLGVAELRFSPRCDVAWGRFTPAPGNLRLTGAMVTITSRRERDHPASAPFTVQFDGQADFGNILVIRNGCVETTVLVGTPRSGQAQSTTRCLTGR